MRTPALLLVLAPALAWAAPSCAPERVALPGPLLPPPAETVAVPAVETPAPDTSPWDARGSRSALDLETATDIVLAVHGGAGTIERENLTPELDAAYRAALAEALLAGYAVLERNGSAEDAVAAAVRPLEDSPLFNAGRGAVLNDEGEVELDASIMRGRDRAAGAIAGARTPRHPIDVARAVMERSEHVLFAAEGADRFVAAQGIPTERPRWFVTPHRQRQLEFLRAEEEGRVADAVGEAPPWGPPKFGTVGCVALDREGHLAAGTSTGGMARKAFGRVGDSPIIGAGTWADDATCAVSCTGHGEFFIRGAIAHQIHARMAFGGAGLDGAARATVLENLPAAGGSGGCVALDAGGRMAAPFTTPGMYRGWIDAEGRVTVRIHGDER
ncbi:MAG: isoaspartyl peptidase/L-asparaginase [Planctomycetota bacterium]